MESTQVKVPRMMVNLGLKMIKRTIHNKVKFDINKLSPIDQVGMSFIPVLFVHGEDDSFIGPHHSKVCRYLCVCVSVSVCCVGVCFRVLAHIYWTQELHAKYAGDKNLILVEGDHNSVRPSFFFDSVSIFFHNMLLTPEEQQGIFMSRLFCVTNSSLSLSLSLSLSSSLLFSSLLFVVVVVVCGALLLLLLFYLVA